MAERHPDKEFVEYVMKAILAHPDEVVVTRTSDVHGVFIQITVHPEDMGTAVGKNGQTATSIRRLLHIIGSKDHARVSMKVVPRDDSAPASAADVTSD